MSEGIQVSAKHGLNPTTVVCFLCNEETGELALLGKLPGDREAPRRLVLNKEPCTKCQEWMKQGIIVISVRNHEQDRENPYRTGGWVVIKEEAVRRMPMAEEMRASILQHRVMFMEDEVWEKLGLPDQSRRGPEGEGESHGDQ